MNKRVLNGLVLGLAVSALALGGCGKDKKKDDGAGGETAGGGGDKGGAARPGGGGAASGVYAVMPADSDMVVGINLGGLKGTPLWDKVWPMIEQEAGSELADFKATCGVDPADAVKSITVGGKQADEDHLVIVAKLGVGKDKVKECLQAYAKKEGEDVEIIEDGQIFGIKGADGKSMWAAWLDDTTLMTSPGAEDNRAFIEERLKGGGSAKDNATFMAVAGQADSSSTLWMAMNMPPEAGAAMGGMAAPKQMWLSLSLTKGMKLNLGVRFEKAADAKSMADMANAQMGPMAADPMVGKFIKKTKIAANGNDIMIDIDLNEQEFTELWAMVEQQLPMLMMMMGGM